MYGFSLVLSYKFLTSLSCKVSHQSKPYKKKLVFTVTRPPAPESQNVLFSWVEKKNKILTHVTVKAQ